MVTSRWVRLSFRENAEIYPAAAQTLVSLEFETQFHSRPLRIDHRVGYSEGRETGGWGYAGLASLLICGLGPAERRINTGFQRIPRGLKPG